MVGLEKKSHTLPPRRLWSFFNRYLVEPCAATRRIVSKQTIEKREHESGEHEEAEHESACILKYPEKSAVAKHCVSRRHKIGEIKLIKEVTNWQELNAWESFFIENGEDLLNIEEAPIKSSLFKLTNFTH